MMRFVQSARAHAHAYPHTPTRIRMRTHTCSSFKETEHCRAEACVDESAHHAQVCVYYCRTYYKVVRGGRRRVEYMCYERRRAEACVDESAHHASVCLLLQDL